MNFHWVMKMNPDFVFESDVVPVYPSRPDLNRYTRRFRVEFIQYPPGTRSIITRTIIQENSRAVRFEHPWLVFGFVHVSNNPQHIRDSYNGYIFGSQNKITDVFKHSSITVPRVKDHVSDNGKICFGYDTWGRAIRPTNLADMVHYFWNTDFYYTDYRFESVGLGPNDTSLYAVANLLTINQRLRLIQPRVS